MKKQTMFGGLFAPLSGFPCVYLFGASGSIHSGLDMNIGEATKTDLILYLNRFDNVTWLVFKGLSEYDQQIIMATYFPTDARAWRPFFPLAFRVLLYSPVRQNVSILKKD